MEKQEIFDKLKGVTDMYNEIHKELTEYNNILKNISHKQTLLITQLDSLRLLEDQLYTEALNIGLTESDIDEMRNKILNL